jgi:hypothetical protein
VSSNLTASATGSPVAKSRQTRAAVETQSLQLLQKSLSALTVQIDAQGAQALTPFINRVGWSEIRQSAVNDAQAYEMSDALNLVRNALIEVGYDPR